MTDLADAVAGPRLETARLLLRPPRHEDFEPWAAFFADPETTLYLGGPRPRALAWRYVITMAGAWPIQSGGAFSIIDRDSGRWLGWTGPWYPEGWNGCEIGWFLAREAWGRGYATEAARAALDWTFDHLDCDEVVHNIPPGNEASKAVARRLGSSYRSTAPMPEPLEDELAEVWSQSRAHWRASRPG